MHHDPRGDAREVMRVPSPAPAPQALAFENGTLWMGSWETQKIYGMKSPGFEVYERANAPGRPVGMTVVGEALRIVCSETSEDHRVIRRYIPGHGFVMNEHVECPEDTGSFLAFDGVHLWLSQRYKKRVLEFDGKYDILMEIAADAQILGIVWVHGHLYLSTWHGKEGGCKIGRTNPSVGKIEYVATLPFAAISLAHDGTRFLTNDPRESAIVGFTLPKGRSV
jgi:hypothetical protein